MARKLNTIRQLSVQCDAPTPSATSRRASLRKQHSEELHDDGGIGIRISLSAKSLRSSTAPKVRVAWDDSQDTDVENQDLKSKSSLTPRRHSAHTAENVLYSRQDLAHKLRMAWQEKEKKSTKLNLLLTDVGEQVMSPQILAPLHPEMNENANLKQIFQKHLRKSSKSNSPAASDTESYPSSARAKQSPTTVVVVPIIERGGSGSKQPHMRCDFVAVTDAYEDAPEVRPRTSVEDEPRPSTAAATQQKRAMFQKRTNSAFQTLGPLRPPLARASSLPTTKSEAKLKLPRKKIKASGGGKRSKPSKDGDGCDQRRQNDVVTMVSLVSASESDADEYEAPPPAKETPTPGPRQTPRPDEHKHFSLRKTVKQVSFQQSSIHAVRSFSASFPARRASVAITTLLLDGAVKKLQKGLEKRAPADDEQVEAKRRLLLLQVDDKPRTTNKSAQPKELSSKPVADSGASCKHTEATETTAKEKKCWETYCRMTRSGLNVSFDTILRGMLTPTEYRLRRKLSFEQVQLEATQGLPEDSN